MLMRIQHKKEEPEMGSRRGVLGIVFFWTQILIFFTSHSTFSQANDISASALDSRKTLDISIGGGLFPPSEPECPPPPPPEPECPPPPLPIPPKSPPPPPIPPKSPPPPPIPPKSPPPPPIPPKSPPPPPPKSPPLPPPTRPSPPPSLRPELQRAVRVIESFRKTITGDPLKITNTWRGKICSDRSAYKGFVCDTTITDNKIRVAAVNFNGFGFSGKRLQLQNFLDGLTDTIVFHVNSNNFTGDVPFGISKIPSLFEFDLSNNKLTGEFPKALLTATNLTFLDVRFNTLTGNLPPQVFTLDLDVLYLNNNFFTGKIPDNLGKTPSLYLTLANNKFTGQIPKSIGQASTLRESLLLNNQLSGCLPYQIGLLKQSTVFDVSMNHLTGPIPHSFACLQNMQYLNLSSNQLYGAVPEPVCKLRNLVSLTLNLNYFTEVGPECRKLIKNKILDVRMNCILDLPSQRSREECKAFFSKKQTCPDPGSMTYVPCKIKPASTEESREERKLVTTPRSYAALENHHP